MTVKPVKHWHIRIQRRCEYNGLYDRSDWRAYREWLVWPRVFATQKAAQAYLEQCFTFKGITGRKMTVSVCESKAHASNMRGRW